MIAILTYFSNYVFVSFVQKQFIWSEISKLLEATDTELGILVALVHYYSHKIWHDMKNGLIIHNCVLSHNKCQNGITVQYFCKHEYSWEWLMPYKNRSKRFLSKYAFHIGLLASVSHLINPQILTWNLSLPWALVWFQEVLGLSCCCTVALFASWDGF